MVFSLTTERLILDDLTTADLPHLRRVGFDRGLMQYVLIWLDTDEQITAFMQHAITETQQGDARMDYILAARDAGTREFAGLTFLEIDRAHPSTAEIGVVLLPRYCNRGYGKEIFGEYLRFGFETLKMHRVFGKCDAQNTPSARMMERCGLTYEGTIREHVWLRDHWRSTQYFGMLAEEYSRTRNGMP
jgi:RimJ/RimL family protein N-acetyltransferase